VCDLETSRMGAPYIYEISHLRVNFYQLPSRLTCTLKAPDNIFTDISFVLPRLTSTNKLTDPHLSLAPFGAH